MRISDWSSGVCSSDLRDRQRSAIAATRQFRVAWAEDRAHRKFAQAMAALPSGSAEAVAEAAQRPFGDSGWLEPDRKSVVSGKSVSVRVDLGGRRISKKNIQMHTVRVKTRNKKK